MNEVIFRQATVADVKSLLRIENAVFTSPWSEKAFRNEFYTNQYAYYLVAEQNEAVIGYAGVWLILDEGHITNIAVHPDYQGKGYGQALLAKLLDTATEKGVIRLTLEVRVSNMQAQKLYRKFGFKDGAIRKQYYPDNQEDALVMWVER
ncbi:ribosomal protein S18-alanine N-acetyltransferase [Paenilisteria rocourtiae]|uniref:[Ribosomal protein bS18]-alanine N-acetyltransferase n=1 Tax=Listeria rocourtiae TaxID=647910 RepID=A0A4R6ZQ40_9LIST|nr:ribosomal protein S18-alanine N-acetyltransferase [Listeria rocourtiae]EUJ42469.1 ribosomal-protein-alanine acetyltransferase [Listeria rocourtiae FSL F6-920]MBC1435774.1 ribosomal protein S18-alanine N-acetyltransferase [Listeria rocourtiae]MBC1604084.1 ribosomal protein S18-alanine N-acetyltransferase [Listeria rocourtiae]TDR54598.1 [SSU ribosomal protein S18P]-alanine acetyltransferase [Listeria rocourtiae]